MKKTKGPIFYRCRFERLILSMTVFEEAFDFLLRDLGPSYYCSFYFELMRLKH